MTAPKPEQPMPETETLTSQPVPELSRDLLAEFTPEALHTRLVGNFDPQAAQQKLLALEGQQVIAVDIGGDKISIKELAVQHGWFSLLDEHTSGKTKDGEAYLEALETKAAHKAHGRGIPVGISFAGPVEGKRPTDGPNVKLLMGELAGKYGGGFDGKRLEDSESEFEKALFGHYLKALDNDAVAGLRAGAVEAARRGHPTQNILYVINGSGLGGAVLRNGQLIAAEPGHLPVVPALNPTGRQEACGMFGRQETCIEKVGGSKVGIEAAWAEQTGQPHDGRDLVEKVKGGDPLALRLYDNSAHLTAAVVQGLANALDVSLTNGSTTVVFHGGIFNFKDYDQRVRQILEHSGSRAPVIVTYEFSPNACIEGAAIASLVVS